MRRSRKSLPFAGAVCPDSARQRLPVLWPAPPVWRAHRQVSTRRRIQGGDHLSSIYRTKRPAASWLASQLSRTRLFSVTASSIAETVLANTRSAPETASFWAMRQVAVSAAASTAAVSTLNRIVRRRRRFKHERLPHHQAKSGSLRLVPSVRLPGCPRQSDAAG